MKNIKSIISCCLLLLLSQGRAQTPIQTQIESASRESFSKEELFSIKHTGSSRQQTLNKYIKQFTVLEVNSPSLTRIASNSLNNIEVNLPLEGSNVTLQLIKSNVIDVNTTFSTQQGKVNYKPGAYYHGIIKGRSNTIVAISFFNDNIIGIISNEKGNYVLGNSNTQERSNEYILYNDADLLIKNDFQCSTDETNAQDAGVPVVSVERAASYRKCVKVYIEADYDLYTKKGSNVNTVLDFVTGLFNVTSTVYFNESISIGISNIKVWTITDPYAGATTIENLLSSFSNQIKQQNGFVGDLAHLLSSRNINKGRAYDIGVLCAPPEKRTSVSGNINPTWSSGFPTYSWNQNVVAHELGHCLGSPHTHACVWNGNNTAIDGCGPAAGYPTEGGCATPPVTSYYTIMSYCHLVNGVSLSLSNGFGAQPGDRIRNYIANANCVANCCPADVTVFSYNYNIALTTSSTWIKSVDETMIVSNSNVEFDANPTNGYVLIEAVDGYDVFMAEPTGNGSFTATALYGCIMPLSVEILGPAAGNNLGTYTWTAAPSIHAYQIVSYEWSYSLDGNNYSPLSNSPSITQQLPPNMDLYLLLKVTSVDGQIATAQRLVINKDVHRVVNPYLSNLTISPNPGNGLLNFTFVNDDMKSIFIYDVMGKNIFNKENIKETGLKIDITNQPKGIYLVKIISGQDVVSKKIVIQ